jgi:hypothetical protein
MDTKEDVTASGLLIYELSRIEKLTLAFFGILDALMNCSLDSFNVIFSRELRTVAADEPPTPPAPSPELNRLRAMRTQLDRSAAKTESVTTTVITHKIPLQERLKAKTRRQAVYSWRPPIDPASKQ